MKKCLFTLNVDGYAPEITKQTFPYLEKYAKKIGAEFYVIDKRKFPNYPVTYEKFQIYDLANQMGTDWNIYIDADALVHPDTFDITELLTKDQVMTCKKDFTPIRFKYDKYFQRYNKHQGAGNWFTIVSDWCLDLWKPLDDLTWQEAVENITPTQDEILMGITPDHLIDDYVVSRNIARFGLNFISFVELLEKHKIPGEFLWHEYLLTKEEKIKAIPEVIKAFNKSPQQREQEFLERKNGTDN